MEFGHIQFRISGRSSAKKKLTSLFTNKSSWTVTKDRSTPALQWLFASFYSVIKMWRWNFRKRKRKKKMRGSFFFTNRPQFGVWRMRGCVSISFWGLRAGCSEVKTGYGMPILDRGHPIRNTGRRFLRPTGWNMWNGSHGPRGKWEQCFEAESTVLQQFVQDSKRSQGMVRRHRVLVALNPDSCSEVNFSPSNIF